ncbi:hypothetical protein JCM8547_008609 [Rhodosporidiobolus lusitaniae]
MPLQGVPFPALPLRPALHKDGDEHRKVSFPYSRRYERVRANSAVQYEMFVPVVVAKERVLEWEETLSKVGPRAQQRGKYEEKLQQAKDDLAATNAEISRLWQRRRELGKRLDELNSDHLSAVTPHFYELLNLVNDEAELHKKIRRSVSNKQEKVLQRQLNEVYEKAAGILGSGTSPDDARTVLARLYRVREDHYTSAEGKELDALLAKIKKIEQRVEELQYDGTPRYNTTVYEELEGVSDDEVRPSARSSTRGGFSWLSPSRSRSRANERNQGGDSDDEEADASVSARWRALLPRIKSSKALVGMDKKKGKERQEEKALGVERRMGRRAQVTYGF